MSTIVRLSLPALALMLSSALAGCGASTGVAGDPGGVRIEGDYVSKRAPNPPFRQGSEPIRLTLGEGEISFTAGCNHFSGRATVERQVLHTRNLGGTEMGCLGGGRQAQDEWMVHFFGSSPRVERDGADLVVRARSSEVRFVPAG